MKIQHAVNLLGLRMQDVVTGFTGVVASVSLDLDGGITATLIARSDAGYTTTDSGWIPVDRLVDPADETQRVMGVPNFEY